jgi:hypothetical protein
VLDDPLRAVPAVVPVAFPPVPNCDPALVEPAAVVPDAVPPVPN